MGAHQVHDEFDHRLGEGDASRLRRPVDELESLGVAKEAQALDGKDVKEGRAQYPLGIR